MNKRYVYIDGIKGFAAIGVTWFHYMLTFASWGFIGWNSGIAQEDKGSYYFEYFPFSLLTNTSFIYLSIAIIALLPTLSFYSTNSSKWVKKEAIIRYFRFLPSIFLCVMISYVLNEFGFFYNQELSQLLNFNWANAFYVGDLSLLNALKSSFYSALLEGDSTFNSVLWVMQVVFIGSYLSYFVIVFFAPLKKRYFIYIALFLVTLYKPIYSLFLAGIIAGDILANTNEKKFSNISILLIIVGFICANFPRPLLPFEILDRLLYSLSAFLIIVGVARSQLAKKFFELPFFVYAGKNSFSIILMHFPVMMSISGYMFLKLYYVVGYELSLFITFVVAIPINYIVADLFSKAIKKPTNYICKKVYSVFEIEK